METSSDSRFCFLPKSFMCAPFLPKQRVGPPAPLRFLLPFHLYTLMLFVLSNVVNNTNTIHTSDTKRQKQRQRELDNIQGYTFN